MKKYLATILILLTFILTYIFWDFELQGDAPSMRDYSQLIASFALVAFAWINYISSRHRLIDSIFNGLDKSYIYHKYLSILSILLIWGHDFTLKIRGFSSGGNFEGNNFQGGTQSVFSDKLQGGATGFHISGKDLGSVSLYLFTAFTIFFLIAYKLEYEKWKTLHKLMLIPYTFGIVHYYLSSNYETFSLNSYSIWMNIINLIGLLSAIYSIFLYEITAFKYRYKVTDIREVAQNTFEITGEPINKQMKYKPGQFAFLKTIGKKKGFPSHPFTISEPLTENQIQFTYKILGDHTAKLKDNLVTGDVIAVDGPYGKFDFRQSGRRQLWIAGGIGVTPFRSFWKSKIPQDYKIDFFYGYNNENDAPYVDELKEIANEPHLAVHLLDSSKNGFLGVQHIEEYVSKDEEIDVFFCGPKVMRDKIINGLKKSNFKIKGIHYEYFQFK